MTAGPSGATSATTAARTTGLMPTAIAGPTTTTGRPTKAAGVVRTVVLPWMEAAAVPETGGGRGVKAHSSRIEIAAGMIDRGRGTGIGTGTHTLAIGICTVAEEMEGE